jgi:hypothetical protein
MSRGNVIERDAGGKNEAFSMDRPVSIAPMMDYTDDRNFS